MYKQTVEKPFLMVRQAINTSPSVRFWNYNKKKEGFQFIKPKVSMEKLSMREPVTSSLELDERLKSRKFEWNTQSLNMKGFLRYQKPYKPPVDAKKQVLQTCKDLIPSLANMKEKELLKYQFSDVRVKFDLLSKIFEKLDHSVPNSMLYMMKSVENVVDFYTTEIKTTTPFDELVRSQAHDELPPNLHIQKDPIRFHPDTDTLFGGLTAFPKSSTIVSGIRTRKKYKGFEAKRSWP